MKTGITARGSASVRELLTMARDHLGKARAELLLADRRLEEYAERLGPPRVDEVSDLLAEILEAVEFETQVSGPEILGRRKVAREVQARQLALWLYYRVSGEGLHETGRKFGLHHSTVHHALRRMEAERLNDSGAKMDKLLRAVQSASAGLREGA